jgi:predicted PurR-regulated permease PerM
MTIETVSRRPRRPRSQRRIRALLELLLLIVVAGVLVSAVFDFLARISAVTVILIGALFFTYAVYPAVDFLRRRLPLWLAIMIVYLALLLIVAIGVAYIGPAVWHDGEQFASTAPDRLAAIRQFVEDPQNPIVARLPLEAREYIANLPVQLLTLVQTYGSKWASQTVSIAFSAIGLTLTLVLIPIVSVYLLADAPRLRAGAVAIVPPRMRPKWNAILVDLDQLLGAYIRGQLLVALIVGVLITIALFAAHVRYALLLGVFAGIMNVIPSVGFIASFLPGTLLAAVDGGWKGALIVAGLLILIQQLESNLISPRIIGENVEVPPLIVLVAILVGAELGGIFGMFIAVPFAGVLRVLWRHLVTGEAGQPAGAPDPAPRTSST